MRHKCLGGTLSTVVNAGAEGAGYFEHTRPAIMGNARLKEKSLVNLLSCTSIRNRHEGCVGSYVK